MKCIHTFTTSMFRGNQDNNWIILIRLRLNRLAVMLSWLYAPLIVFILHYICLNPRMREYSSVQELYVPKPGHTSPFSSSSSSSDWDHKQTEKHSNVSHPQLLSTHLERNHTCKTFKKSKKKRNTLKKPHF